MKKVALYNLGCKVNAYETEAMGEEFQAAGYQVVPFSDKADIYVINTCTVTNTADQKSRQIIHRARRRNPESVIVAAGCYVETLDKKDDSIDVLIDNSSKKDVVRIVEEYLGVANPYEAKDKELSIRNMTDHTRVFVKIQDGCNEFCSYCVIPFARGRVRSRQPEDILEEIRGLAAAGYKEVVLTGIHVSSYGSDWKNGRRRDEDLLELLALIHDIPGIRRIRFGSLEPRIITEEFVEGLKKLPKFCPHFHLSLQSGCDKTLKAMNRHYSAEEFYEACLRIRKVWPKAALTTDVIVGFPGETEEDFFESRRFLEKIRFFETHVFPYSRRRGTRADKMEGQLTESVKHERVESLLELNRVNRNEYVSSFVGEEVEIILEEPVEIEGIHCFSGHTREYVKCAVPVSETGDMVGGDMVTATGTEIKSNILICNIH